MKRMNRIVGRIAVSAVLMSALTLTLTGCAGIPITGATVKNFFDRTKPTAGVPSDLSPRVQSQLRDFDFAVTNLKKQYVNAASVGTDWQRTVDAERQKIIDAKDEQGDQFATSLGNIVLALKDVSASLSAPAQPQAQATGQPRFSGIGILAGLPEVGKDRILALYVFPDSPADRGGLKAHDAIVAIEGKPVTFADRDTLIPHLRGAEGTDVTISVRTPGQQPRDITLTRRPVTQSSPLVSKRVTGTNIGYIVPDPSNTKSMKSDVINALRDLNSDHNIDGLVLDLRIIRANDFPLEDMLSLFVNGQVASVQTRAKKTKLEIGGRSIGGSQEVPLVVLVSDQTVGQAEAFAGILQDLGRAKIAGQQTKGDMAQVTPLTLPTSHLQVLIPTGEYIGVKNNNWRGTNGKDAGVKPNIVSAKAWEDFTTDDDPQLQQAVDALSGK